MERERRGIQKAVYTQETAKGNSQIDGEGRSQDECCVPGLEDNQTDTSPRGWKALGEPF